MQGVQAAVAQLHGKGTSAAAWGWGQHCWVTHQAVAVKSLQKATWTGPIWDSEPCGTESKEGIMVQQPWPASPHWWPPAGRAQATGDRARADLQGPG